MDFVRQRRYLALRTGVTAASASVGASFARGLLPRSTRDQAMLTGATAAYWLVSATLGLSVVESVAELVVRARGRGTPENTALLASGVVMVAGATAVRAIPNSHEAPLPSAFVRSAGWVLGGGALATTLVVSSDKVIRRTIGPQGPVVGIAVAAGLGGISSMVSVRRKGRRAAALGQDYRPRQFTSPPNKEKLADALVTGGAVCGGLLTLAGGEFAIAEGSTRVVSRLAGRADDPVTPLVGHAVAGATLGYGFALALNRMRRRLMHADDMVEPAYPEPPAGLTVTAGPNSIVGFDSIGKEGRRFVLMTLTPDQISQVMGEPAKAPVRAVAGYESARTPRERALVALAELENLGAYERSVIVVAAPTGVGYVNYSFAEALEYLTRGDCAILVPQYALVPSALALNQTSAGVRLQTLVLAGIRDRIAQLPPERRPRLLQYGESLGAQVALDVAQEGTHVFAELGVSAGLYLGTPFRTRLWDRWSDDPASVDADGLLGCVSQADQIPTLPPSVRHVQVIHHDDPINKFSYASIVRTPWWMGPPQSRPPGVPRETTFRPVITFIISLVDLKNGMNSKPGQFVRLGHDYRIELREALQHTFGLSATPEQQQRIEQALRRREQEWAARRMVARRFASARSSAMAQLTKWGVDPSSVGLDASTAHDLARGNLAHLAARLGTSSGSAE